MSKSCFPVEYLDRFEHPSISLSHTFAAGSVVCGWLHVDLPGEDKGSSLGGASMMSYGSRLALAEWALAEMTAQRDEAFEKLAIVRRENDALNDELGRAQSYQALYCAAQKVWHPLCQSGRFLDRATSPSLVCARVHACRVFMEVLDGPADRLTHETVFVLPANFGLLYSISVHEAFERNSFQERYFYEVEHASCHAGWDTRLISSMYWGKL